ncbi:tRNA (adenosine(37)-N6)-threonylcarbamoyltransferase complex ATPase subunit type 1 TsaE [Kineosporia succinea]|uniref:tRNA threonylcarbamoyladenosine biosynthesis protein TsaE n=1 Tax=Kineosporia succinea TaxID=84632 RepID=A0ABT9P3H5_9ACTN|nr:tRNA (adenosine(37)-N6)-threonylcarbamoyltransferase complex ATPase subunit type 1 TsaE [Kineosporia succinea]MDP9827228.1 tRNA threonylcarbamoyladenosine biosynthesis protein TsaE [Kineosporia succinea]
MSGAHRADPAGTVDEPAVTVTSVVPAAADMRELGELIAARLRPGDLLVLTGDLGAGKTTLTQGIGARLRVRGDITSPTFVIARVHPPTQAGPPLVHVDAYRLETLSEVDDLDLDADLSESVTVVEWGEGLVEGLAADRLEVRLERPRGANGPDDPESIGDEPRTVRLRGFGPRWAGVDLPSL